MPLHYSQLSAFNPHGRSGERVTRHSVWRGTPRVWRGIARRDQRNQTAPNDVEVAVPRPPARPTRPRPARGRWSQWRRGCARRNSCRRSTPTALQRAHGGGGVRSEVRSNDQGLGQQATPFCFPPVGWLSGFVWLGLVGWDWSVGFGRLVGWLVGWLGVAELRAGVA